LLSVVLHDDPRSVQHSEVSNFDQTDSGQMHDPDS
jgi:hypothetical protein